jgi:hypothetical protein
MSASCPALVLGHLPPSERHTAIELTERWGAFVTGWAGQKLGEQKAEAA